ncbi:XRE family transcriptional regulator [Enterobacter cloacae]|uniref:XRE family transcriptional regulator n=1 Tax=Enterobacter cloacae TaxID=550 RepID=UPI0010DAF9A3|nr:LexA family transcriptional regulator [Enterobacter cloacae]MCK6800936.1 LexA family transcriptional regulator [Enterobacter cloacae]TAT65366.1 LexA family transcriptional regulator [Enterobacter cloacae]HDC4513176.1 LexA family transcriptional regulator [Enterobacter cloacae]
MNNKKQSTKEFSERLKHVIAALGTTGREFSKRAGIGYSTVHNYMHGSSSPTLDNLVLLAKAGNVSIEWLATGQQSSMSSTDSHVILVPFIDHADEMLNLDAQLLDVTDLHSLRAIRVNTDVMTPTFLMGAVLLIDTNDTNLTDNKLVVLKQSGNYLFKRVQVLMEGVRLLSDNDNYPSIAVAFEDMKSINVIGAVVMIINKVN